MRVLFTSWAWPTHFYPMVPLAWAFRNAGHQVAVASQPSLLPTIAACGLTGIQLGTDADIADPLGRLKRQDRNDNRPRTESRTVARYAEMADAMAEPMRRLVEAWSPDLVVYEETTYAAPLVAQAAGIPAVRHLWGVDVMSYVRWSEAISLATLAARIGCPSAEGSLVATVDPCPPSLQVPADYPRTAMRYVPYNGTAPAPRWLDSPPTRRRVCVTYGKTLSKLECARPVVDRLIAAAGALDAEVVAAISAQDRDRLGGAVPSNVRVVVDQPLATFLPGCSLMISHGGPGTALTAAAHGVRQLSIPQVGDQILLAELTTQQGCGRRLSVEDAEVGRIVAEAEALLASDEAARAAVRLAEENAARPPPAAVAEELAALVTRSRHAAPA